MLRLRHKLFVRAMRALDPILLFGALLFILAEFQGDTSLPLLVRSLYEASRPPDLVALALLVAGWFVVLTAIVPYDADRLTTLRSEVVAAVAAPALSAFVLFLVSTAFSFGRVTNEVVLAFLLLSTAVMVVTRMIARAFLMVVRRSGYNYRHLLIVGYNPWGFDTASRIERLPELGYKVVGFVAEGGLDGRPEPSGSPQPVLGSLRDIQAVLENRTVDEMMVCLPLQEHAAAVLNLVRLAQELGIVLRILPDPSNRAIVPRVHLERFGGDYVVTLFREQSLLQLLGKRMLDAAGSAILLACLSPLLLAVALAIKLTSPGPVLFVQKRVGMNRRSFNLYKFRSMYVDAEKRRQGLAHLNEMDGPVFKIANDPRVTPVGRFIRRTSIDELPQLINVLTGRMSLVGPRPPLADEVDQYEWLFRKRLSIKPGITCLWQVSGRNQLSFREWMELDRRYVSNWSLWLDVKILLMTIPAVLGGRGAS